MNNEDELFSNCCGYSTPRRSYPAITDMGVCPQCLEHCEFVNEDDEYE
jgi:hypothetical protein